jgi:hypothetical protein
MQRQHAIGPYDPQQRRRDEERRQAEDTTERDVHEPRRDVRPRDDAPKFGPPRPDLDPGTRGAPSIGEAGAYGPRSDMMGYGGYEADAYGREDASDFPVDAAERPEADEETPQPTWWTRLVSRFHRAHR